MRTPDEILAHREYLQTLILMYTSTADDESREAAFRLRDIVDANRWLISCEDDDGVRDLVDRLNLIIKFRGGNPWTTP